MSALSIPCCSVSAPIMTVAVERKERREDEGEVNERREGREAAKDGGNNKHRRQNGCQEREREREGMKAEMRWRLNHPETTVPHVGKNSVSHLFHFPRD